MLRIWSVYAFVFTKLLSTKISITQICHGGGWLLVAVVCRPLSENIGMAYIVSRWWVVQQNSSVE